MHRKLNTTLFLSAAILALTSCTGMSDATDDATRQGVTISLCTQPSLNTRTTLTSDRNVQHVSQVQLYVFDGTSDNATCVASEDTGWDPTGATGGLPTREQTYKLKYTGFKPQSTYTLIAVGSDDASLRTYQPLSIGTTLSQARATATTIATRHDIAQSELFGGSLNMTMNDEGGFEGTIDLYRRVAGVLVSLVNIPSYIETDGTRHTVAKLSLQLYTQQNRSTPLASNNITADPLTSTDATENEANRTVLEIAQSEVQRSTNLTEKGAYLLPIAAPTDSDTPTLSLVFADSDGNTLRTLPVKLVETTTDSDGNKTTTKRTAYPILANQLYKIEANFDTETQITIEVEPAFEGRHEFDVI